MNGPMKSYDEEQQAVDKYVEEIGLYEEKEPLRFILKAYARDMLEHVLEDPDQVPAEIMESFWTSATQKLA